MLVMKPENENEETRGTEGARRATGVAREAAGRNGDNPDPEVTNKAIRRRFSAAYKRRVVREADRTVSIADAASRWGKACMCRTRSPCEPSTGPIRSHGLSGRRPIATAHSMTARMRWRNFRAVDGMSCQIGAIIPITSAPVTSEIGIFPARPPGRLSDPGKTALHNARVIGQAHWSLSTTWYV